jgi:glycosyltransferase involved in cell wall biosynthesis
MVGPFAKIDMRALPTRASVHYTGRLPYADLPRILAGLDVGIMPFARNEATANISPTKTPEYLAAGLPVVSTEIPDVATLYGEVVRFARTPAEFVAAARAALVPDEERRARGRVLAAAMDWDRLVDGMWHEMARRLFGEVSTAR